MNRRDFLTMGTCAAVLPTLGAPAAERDAGKLPGWAEARIDAAVARYLQWKGGDETVAFTFMTDTHSYVERIADPPDFGNSRYHALFAMAAADRAGCDFLVEGGDHDYDHGNPSREVIQRRMDVVRGLYEGYAARPVLFCLGNHDHGPFADDRSLPRPVSSRLFGETFNGLAVRHGHKLVFGDNPSWGYYDIPAKKFRAVFCNTSDEGYYGFSQAQVEFVERTLDTLPAGWTVALFGHYCVFNEIGHWKQSTGVGAKRKAEFMGVLEGFAQRRPNTLAGYFCGDSHFDNEMDWRGVCWTISQGYGGIGRGDKPWGARTIAFDRSRDMLFELVAVKPSIGEFKVFRVGAGDAAFDRLCVYFNRLPHV